MAHRIYCIIERAVSSIEMGMVSTTAHYMCSIISLLMEGWPGQLVKYPHCIQCPCKPDLSNLIALCISVTT